MKRSFTPLFWFFAFICPFLSAETFAQSQQMDLPARKPVVVRQGRDTVHISWRMLATDPVTTGFNVYRNGRKLNAMPLINATSYMDTATNNYTYTLRPVINGVEQTPIPVIRTSADKVIPRQDPAGGYIPPAGAFSYSISSRPTLGIRPNPVDNTAYINYSSENNRLVLVVAAGDGNVIFRRTGSLVELNNGLNAIVGSFASGIYMMQLQDGQQLYWGKMVKL